MARLHFAAIAALFTGLLLAYLLPLPSFETMGAPLVFSRIVNRVKPASIASLQKPLTSSLGPTTRSSAFNTPSPNHRNNFSSTSSTMSDSTNFIQAVQDRRSIYQLNKKSPVPDNKVEELARAAMYATSRCPMPSEKIQ